MTYDDYMITQVGNEARLWFCKKSKSIITLNIKANKLNRNKFMQFNFNFIFDQ